MFTERIVAAASLPRPHRPVMRYRFITTGSCLGRA